MRFNDEICNSCNVTVPPDAYDHYVTYIDFDCRNVDGGSYGDTTKINLFPAILECFKPPKNPVQCELCPGENTGVNSLYLDTLEDTLINVNGYGTFSCYNLAKYSYYDTSIPPDACPQVVDAIDSQCCSPICDLCGEGVPLDLSVIANFSEYGEVPCFLLEGMLADPTQCAVAKPLLVEACCGQTTNTPAPTGSPSDGQGATPGPTSGQVSTTPPPTEGNNSDMNADGVSRVALSKWSAVMMVGGAGSFLMIFFATY